MKFDNLHPLQMFVLRKMMALPRARFRDLKIAGFTTDHVTYHIQALVKIGLIEKAADNYYVLTDNGKSFVGQIDEHTATLEGQGKRGVLVRLSKREKGKTLYLVNRRLKQPFYHYVGFHTGKIKEGESVHTAAARELKEETGLVAELHLVAVFHWLDYKPDGEFLRDIYFYVFNAFQPKGVLIENNPAEGVENFWVTLKELKTLKTFPGFWQKAMLLQRKSDRQGHTVKFVEKERVVSDY